MNWFVTSIYTGLGGVTIGAIIGLLWSIFSRLVKINLEQKNQTRILEHQLTMLTHIHSKQSIHVVEREIAEMPKRKED
jgi:ABC-type lipoprotein release transport system permease subunit